MDNFYVLSGILFEKSSF